MKNAISGSEVCLLEPSSQDQLSRFRYQLDQSGCNSPALNVMFSATASQIVNYCEQLGQVQILKLQNLVDNSQLDTVTNAVHPRQLILNGYDMTRESSFNAVCRSVQQGLVSLTLCNSRINLGQLRNVL